MIDPFQSSAALRCRFSLLAWSALAALGGAQALAQTSTLSSVAIGTMVTAGGTANGVATVTPRVGTALNQSGSVGNNLAGLQYVAGQVPLTGSPASIAFYALTGAAIPGGAANPASAFTSYGTLVSPTAVTTYADVASKLTPNSYSALTYAAADLGFGAGNFYTIHHTAATDYVAAIVPGTGTASSIADLKPMSWSGPTAGGPASIGTAGYFGLAWATGILSAGAPYFDQSLYYLRSDTNVPSHTRFGVMIPALTGGSTDTLDLTTAVGSFGVGGYTTLAFSPSAIGNYGSNQFYYLRQDTGPGGTGNTILGWLNPSLVAGTRTISDIANLGGVFTTLSFAPDATGPSGAWGSTQFYVTGALATNGQSVSFAAIPNHNVGDVFVVTPTASSGLDLAVTVVSGPATVQTTGTAGATPSSLLVFTVTTTGPGIVTLQARQAGQTLPTAYAANELQQSFDVLGLPAITSPTAAAATAGSPFSYVSAATGSPTSYTSSPLPAGLVLNAATGAITGTPTTAGTTVVTLTAVNATGSGSATLTITVAPANAAPIITSPATAAATAGAPFTYASAATGTPTGYTATGLPVGLTVNATTGVITGTPTTAGTWIVTLTATNATGASSATITITVAPVGVPPVITSPATAPATVGAAFPIYTIGATGGPTSYTATGLPAGLTINPATGAISGTPTAPGVSVVTVTATNGTGSGTATVTITVGAAGIAPLITSPASATATVGATFPTYYVGGTDLPTSYAATGLPAGLTINPLTGAITGTPTASGTFVVTITATNGVGTGSRTLTIAIAPTSLTRISNFSARALSGPGSDSLIMGFVVSGNGENLLVRGIGPTLAGFGITNFLPDPFLTIYSSTGAVLATDETWGTNSSGVSQAAAITAADTLVGAFALTPGSLDSALLITFNNGAGTTGLLSPFNPAGGTGVALVEMYDMGSTAGTHLVNVSARMNVTGGDGALIAGLGISGTAQQDVLIRGVGPALAALGVTGVLADPVITVYAGGTAIATNAGWGTGLSSAAQVTAVSAAVGAFPLPAGSKDSALLLTLQPGSYTVVISSTSGSAGVALVEVYTAP